MESPNADGGAAQLTGVLDELRRLAVDNKTRIEFIESKLQASDLPRRTLSTIGPLDHTAQSVTDDTDYSQEYMYLSAKKTIPAVRECTFSEFKNRYDPKGADGCYAMDALVSGSMLRQEIEEEHRLRDQLLGQRVHASPSPMARDKARSKAVKMAKETTDLITQAQAGAKWLRRLRIQSPALLRILARVNREKWNDRPRTYFRPFHALIYHHEQMRKVLLELEEDWGKQLDGAAGAPAACEGTGDANEGSAQQDSHDGGGSGGGDDDDDSVVDSPEALACMRAYVKFIDERIMKDYHRFEKMDTSSNAQVRFSDLWYLFRTGELVYRPVDGENPGRRDTRTGKHIWKTYYIEPVAERLVAESTDDMEIREAGSSNDDSPFIVGCYYVDYTGEEFCVVKQSFKIEQFPGEMLVSNLPIYPMRFCLDWKQREDQMVQRGEALVDFLKVRHCFYNGWTVTRTPTGEPAIDVKGEQLQQPEHVNSEVMVDFGEACQQCPAWRPQRANMREEIVESLTVLEDFRIRWWSSPDRETLLGETTEMIPVKAGVSMKLRNKHISEDEFLKTVSDNIRLLRHTTAEHLTRDAKALLTGRVFAYVFQERKFAQLAVGKLRPCPKTGLALDSLKIPPTVKRAIQGSVQGHFLQKRAERNVDQEWASLDLIQGKGTGLFILLHGVPGVGKTATAEAIAQANGKPLFKITVGDLGMTPERLESSLREIFRLASNWDCVLLLDEVDTFFSQRSRADTATTKNALVSVFLRVLDYYDGILFLTTNRAGVLDEAFKSRIHYKIYYPDLTLEQTLDIWKLNIQRVRKIDQELARSEDRDPLQINDKELLDFARIRFTESGGYRRGYGRWNGRQIRNAFQVARNLAYYEYAEELRQCAAADASRVAGQGPARDWRPGPPMLDIRHFETMHSITASFENYRTAVHGGTNDAELALEAEFRNDTFRDPLTEDLQAEYRDEHARATSTAAGQDRVARESVDPDTGDVVTTTVAVSSKVHRPQYYHSAEGDGVAAAEGPVISNRHRGSAGTRPRAGSFLAPFPDGSATSPPSSGYEYGQTGPPVRMLPIQSQRPGPSREPTDSGPESPQGSAPPGVGYQGRHRANSYNQSPHGGSSYLPATTGSYRSPTQNGHDGGGMLDRMNSIPISPRGVSPGMGEGMGDGRDAAQPGYYGSPADGSFAPGSMGRDRPRMHGGGGYHAGPEGWRGSASSYGNSYSSHRPDSLSRTGQQHSETDLSADGRQ